MPPQSLLRVEVRLDNTTTPGVAACMGEPKDLNAGCVAFFDVRLWANERQVRDSGEGILDWVMTSVLPIRFHIHKGAFGCLEPANLVHIPDTNLKAAFREALNKPSEDITCEDMQLLTGSFWAGGRSIVDLQGIQYARNLLLLDFSHNRIADLSPLADTNWPKLEVLYLNGNQLEDISPLADTNWPTLRWLYLDDNQISNVLPLAVSNWPHLMALSLINNQIGDPTPLKTLVNLIGLRLSGNEIRDVTSFANMTNLIELRLSHNQITDVSALSGKRFSDLHLDNNEITDLSNVDFYAAPMDRYPPSVFIGDLAGYLNLSSNQINDLTDSNLGGFQWTYLNHNQISNLANATIEGMYIHLSNNQLRTLSSEARIGSFDLYLDYNQLTDISAMVEGGWYNFRISVTNNCLDVSEGSQAREDFQALVDGGFTDHFVLYEPQRELTQPPCSN